MPIEVRAIRERRKTVTVSLGEDASVVFDYFPAKAALIDADEIKRLAAESVGKPKREQRLILAHALCGITGGWDVTQDGEPFPLDADALAEAFDDAFLGFCIGSLVEDANTGKVSGELSSVLGTVSTSPTVAAASSPAMRENRASRRSAKSPKSPSNAGSRRGSSRTILSGSPSSARG